MSRAGGGIEMTLIGAEKARKLLAGYTTKVVRPSLRKALRAGAKIVTAAAKRTAPKKTGALVRAIKTRAMTRSRTRIGVMTAVKEGWFKGNQFYAGFHEFGWHIGKRARGGKRSRAARGETRTFREGTHFLEKAATRRKRRVAFVVTRILRAELKKRSTPLALPTQTSRPVGSSAAPT